MNNPNDTQGTTPLHRAGFEGRTADVEDLVSQGADVNAQDRLGRTPLMRAAAQGHTETVQSLIDLGADVRLRDNEGRTAYQFAWSHARVREALDTERAEMTRDLARQSVKRPMGGQDGWTNPVPDTLVLQPGELQDETINALVRAGAEVDHPLSTGWSPLMLAIMVGTDEAVRALISVGADVNFQSDGETPLSLAKKYRPSIQAILREAGARN